MIERDVTDVEALEFAAKAARIVAEQHRTPEATHYYKGVQLRLEKILVEARKSKSET
jgi:hypothetical protein